ncbi:uncharacterized protein V6R79_021175 [Siganus canaliculatus]
MKHNEIITVFCALLHIQLLSGSSLSDQVHQTPPDMFTQQGQTAQIQCSHRIQDYNVILWTCLRASRLMLHFDGFSTGFSLSDQVHQSPPDMFSDPGKSTEITCSHSIDSYDRILWYKQSEGRLQLLGYMVGDSAAPETGQDVKIEGNANKDQNCTLTVEKLTNMDVISWKQTLLTLSVFVLGMAGLIDGSDVNQPELLWKEKGKEATISCNHTKDITYDQMYWYRQLPGETMKLIVFTRFGIEDHDFGDSSKDKFSATKPDAQSGTFTVKNLLPEDNGVYFCAVSQHSDEDELQGCSKTSAQQETRECRQDENRALKLLGYLNTQFPYPEEDVKDKISFDGDGSKESSLSVSGLELKDSGVYFCAASRHSAAGSRGVETKTLCCSSH